MTNLQLVRKGEKQGIKAAAQIGYPPDLVKELPCLIQIMGSGCADMKEALKGTIRLYARAVNDEKYLDSLQKKLDKLYHEAEEKGLIDPE